MGTLSDTSCSSKIVPLAGSLVTPSALVLCGAQCDRRLRDNGMPALWRGAALLAARFDVPTFAQCYVTSPESTAAHRRAISRETHRDTALLPELAECVARIVMHEGLGLSAVLRDHLWAANVRTAFLAGVDTEAHILSATFGLLDAGIEPIIVAPLCFAHAGRAAHDAVLNLVRRQVGDFHVCPTIPWGSSLYLETTASSSPVVS
jgi:RES domain-containing protein